MPLSRTPAEPPTTRFAPSPTGLLHKGHAFSAWLAWRFAKERGGRFLLRVEDIDATRCDPNHTRALIEDLAWLGLDWEEPVRLQSEHLADYENAATRLREGGWLYPCFCTRQEIQAEIHRAGQAPHAGESLPYPGTCRRLDEAQRRERLDADLPHAWRLDLGRALESLESLGASGEAGEATAGLAWDDSRHGRQRARPELLGDAVVVRKDIGTSYHLAVVVDDALQGVTDVVRGEDLFESTHLHRVLQALLKLPAPRYHHHPLLTDAEGRRLAKRDRSLTLRALRESGVSPGEIRAELEEAISGFGL